MATIEPRLIHLLNEPTTPQLNHADLPPLYSLPLPASTERPLPPLEPDTSHRSTLDGTCFTFAPPALSSDESTSRKDDARLEWRNPSAPIAHSLRLLLGDGDAPEPSLAYAKILNDSSDTCDESHSKKRARTVCGKDDFVQLPQPVKKQKAAQQAPPMPPIINGLHEPPPQATLFPPISSESFGTNHGTSNMKFLSDVSRSANDKANTPTSSDADRNANKARKRAVKPRRKWSEQETKHLLLGVNRHGVGKWTTILDDADFTFNARTAGDLKDRFRTCCPDELRGPSKKMPRPASPPHQPRQSKPRAKKGIHSENILIEENNPSPPDSIASQQQDSDTAPKQKRSRAHRKKMEDLAQLGIHGPFKKSLRRERRPFTEQDDREILEGLDIYGPAWTKIQRDPRYHLSSRQPTDLRDRVRNKYPAVYGRIDKGAMQAADDARGNNTLEPSISISIDDSFQRSRTAHAIHLAGQYSFRERTHAPSLHTLDTIAGLTHPQTFEFAEVGAPHLMGGGEMDISRLLLDDSRLTPLHPRHSFDGFSGPSSPSANGSEQRRERTEGHKVKC
ncbi:hypothetical protein CDD81_5746 [Ophiocordyceps australis]|uniref:Myb-like domain-containing protein n=1 Tax=Ophiocordyceps australis TaxID=1399860 RepID=A0A2C5X9V5_9HYPO|nr:hypothetical protein CDD81_5746 [Ophiocordyceps australis]